MHARTAALKHPAKTHHFLLTQVKKDGDDTKIYLEMYLENSPAAVSQPQFSLFGFLGVIRCT